jgi:DNA-binding transcriptional ArsR family regulator
VNPACAVDECAVELVDPAGVALVGAVMPGRGTLRGWPMSSRCWATRASCAAGGLLETGELCVGDLAATGMSGSAVSHALRLLRAHRVVSVSRRGLMAFYELADGQVRMLLDLGWAQAGRTSALHHRGEGDHR